MSGASTGSSRPAARNGAPSSSAATTAGNSSRLVRARIARVVGVPPSVSGGHERRAAVQRPTAPPEAGGGGRGWGVVARRGGEDHGAGRLGPCSDPFREAFTVPFDQPNRADDDRARAAVVRHEVHSSEARQRGFGEPEQPSNVGESPAVDRLVVVTDEE